MLQELVEYKNAVKQNYFSKIVDHYTAFVDSSYSARKDTLVISNISRAQRTLRRQEFHFDKTGCKQSLLDAYFDTSGRKLYEEQWKMGCNWENDISGFLQNRYKYHYDSTGRETGMTMESYDGAGHRVQKFDYTIDAGGKKIWGKRTKLNSYAFWD